MCVYVCLYQGWGGGGGSWGATHHAVANLHILHGEKCAKSVFSA